MIDVAKYDRKLTREPTHHGVSSLYESDRLWPNDCSANSSTPELGNLIVSRIESRLAGRIRHLTVFTTKNAVILTGECSSFYTKQLAQHAAMGVLEYEQLINNIEVNAAP